MALGYAGGVGARAPGRRGSEAATALLLVAALARAAWCSPATCSSPARRRPPAVRHAARRSTTGDLALSAASRALAARGTLALGRTWTAHRLRPRRRARARPARRARRPGAAGARRARRGRGASRPWGRCWWRRSSCSPPPPARLLARSVPGAARLGASALAARRGAARPLPRLLAGPAARARRRRARRAVYGVLALAAALRGRRARRARRRDASRGVASEGLSRRLRRPAGAARRDASPRRRASRSACSGPTAAARPRSSARCSASSPGRRQRRARRAGPAYVAQTERTRLDFPVSAARRGADGHARARALVAAARAATSAPRRAGGARARGARRAAARARSASCRAASASARCWPGRWCRTRRVLLLDEPLAGVDPASAELIASVFDELRAEGRTLLVSTPRRRAAPARFDLVLCLNGRQVAFGAARRGARPRDARGDLRPRADRARRRRRAARATRAAPPRALTMDLLDPLLDPLRSGIDRRALLEVALLGAVVRRARLLGRERAAELRRRVALPRAAARPGARRAGRRPAAARRGRRRARWPRL